MVTASKSVRYPPAEMLHAWFSLPYITPQPCQNRGGRAWASRPVSATRDPSASHRSPRRLFASGAAVLWHGAESAGVADAMIEAMKTVYESFGCHYVDPADGTYQWET